MYRNVVVDLDGVVYLDGDEIPGAGAALHEIDRLGGHILFATNNASRPRAEFSDRIASIISYPARPEQVVSSAMAAASLLRQGEQTMAVAGPGVCEAAEQAGAVVVEEWATAEAVVVGFDVDMTYRRLRDAALAIRNGARFIAANGDLTFPAPDGLWPGAGSTVAFLEAATGRAPEAIAGKPYRPFRDLVGELLEPGETLMVGDRPETDLATGIEAGWDTALVLTGVTSSPDDVIAQYTPTHVLGSIAGVPALLRG